MIGVADVFEALTAADRPYKSGMSLSQALDIMVKMRNGGHIDPRFVRRVREPGRAPTLCAQEFLDPSTDRRLTVLPRLAPSVGLLQKPLPKCLHGGGGRARLQVGQPVGARCNSRARAAPAALLQLTREQGHWQQGHPAPCAAASARVREESNTAPRSTGQGRPAAAKPCRPLIGAVAAQQGQPGQVTRLLQPLGQGGCAHGRVVP